MSRGSKPLVSILCLAYNHEKYIEQALESFVRQKANFNFEVIVHDDASTDRTQDAIRKYEKLYPSIIKPIYQKKNQYQERGALIVKDLLDKAQGEYIAQCEADDYWTDDNKLAEQVKFMQNHPEYALCFHPVKVIYQNSEQKSYIYPDTNSNFTIGNLIKKNYIQSNSVIYRKANYEGMSMDVMPLDWFTHLYHAQFGKIGFINKVMSVYRRHDQGIWWNAQKNIEKLWEKYGVQQVGMFVALNEIYGKNRQYARYINGSMFYLIDKFIDTDRKNKTDLFRRVLSKYPDVIVAYSSEHLSTVRDLFNENQSLKEKSLQLERRVEEADKKIEQVRNSKFWKAKRMQDRIRGRVDILNE